MKNVIEKYKKFIFVFGAINLFALAVNLFNIKGHFNDGSGGFDLFTSSVSPGGFWPFVTYVYNYNDGNRTSFNGIFHGYGISEFLFYMGILIMFLVYKAYIAKPVLKHIH